MPDDEWQEKTEHALKMLHWEGPWYSVSAVDGRGTDKLCADIMHYIEAKQEELQEEEKTLSTRTVTYPEPELADESLADEFIEDDPMIDEYGEEDGPEVIYTDKPG